LKFFLELIRSMIAALVLAAVHATCPIGYLEQARFYAGGLPANAKPSATGDARLQLLACEDLTASTDGSGGRDAILFVEAGTGTLAASLPKRVAKTMLPDAEAYLNFSKAVRSHCL
jgi:hypothetical protein